MGMSGLMTGDKATRLHMIQCPVANFFSFLLPDLPAGCRAASGAASSPSSSSSDDDSGVRSMDASGDRRGWRRAVVRGADGRWAVVAEVGMMETAVVAMVETGVGRFQGPSMAALLVLILRLRSRSEEVISSQISTYYSGDDSDSDGTDDD
uniref:Uncharacterized protein n=1 Tax=Oryza sativa subsp. japonica TaxID=39947 RepID=Q5SML6_ORYSJ|nr:hypothetical protein [Oryza sativa Japonica Group]